MRDYARALHDLLYIICVYRSVPPVRCFGDVHWLRRVLRHSKRAPSCVATVLRVQCPMSSRGLSIPYRRSVGPPSTTLRLFAADLTHEAHPFCNSQAIVPRSEMLAITSGTVLVIASLRVFDPQKLRMRAILSHLARRTRYGT